jgi:hypothetical protein
LSSPRNCGPGTQDKANKEYFASIPMGLNDTSDLNKFLKPFSPEIKKMALGLREFIWKLYPNCNELVYDNYNALAFGWSISDKLGDTFCSIAVMEKYCHFGFYRGVDISDPEKKLLGQGNQYRYIKVHKPEDFPKTYIKKLLKEAYANAVARKKIASMKKPAKKAKPEPVVKGQTITKMTLVNKRRPK